MNATAAAELMTTEQFLALPDDGVERWLIRGKLYEKKKMTKRSRHHGRLTARIAYLLGAWLEGQPEPRGEVYDGEVGCRLRSDPDSTVGIDVAYLTPAQVARQGADTTLIDGPPALAVEVLSPNDTQEEINNKIDEHLAASVPLVWVVDPRRRTVVVCRPKEEPELFNVTQELSGDPHLPGLRIPVGRLFTR